MSSCISSSATVAATNAPFNFEGLLETTIPGFSIISSIAKTYLRIDVSQLISTLLPLALLIAAVRYVYDPLVSYVTQYGTSTAEIRNDDEMFNYVIYWISRQKFSSKSRSFLVGTRITSDLVYDSISADNDDPSNQEEADWKLADENFEKFWAKTTARDKYKTMYYTPNHGTHYFQFQGSWLCFNRQNDENPYNRYGEKRETLAITCFGRDGKVIKALLKEAQKLYVEKDRTKTVVYRREGVNDDWSRCMSRPPRPLSTVVLDNKQKTALVNDVREYLHPLTKRWYANRGIPYRRGYLLYGPPGTGKTSLCVALAGMFGLDVYVTSLNSRSLTEDGLATLFSYLPERCVVLLEDVDTAGITNKRTAEVATTVITVKTEVESASDGSSTPGATDTAIPAGISLSGLLNVIDGVSSSEGRILIMTTNHVAKLDPALLRPGRVDMSIAFENANTATATEMFRSTYTSREEDYPPTLSAASETEASGDAKPAGNAVMARALFPRRFDFSDAEIIQLAEQFASQLPSGEFSPAEIQGYLLKHKSTPRQAADGVVEWMTKLREEKERQRAPAVDDPHKLSETPVMV